MGSGGLILRVAYEVFVLTTGLPLLRFITSPASLVIAPGAPGSFNLIGLVAPDPPRGSLGEYVKVPAAGPVRRRALNQRRRHQPNRRH